MSLRVGRSQSRSWGRLSKSTGAKHQDQRCGLRRRRPAGRISAYGQRDMGKRLCQPGQGRRLGRVRPSERRDGGSRRPANPARGCRGGGRPHDPGPGSSSDHTQRCRRRCLRRQWRHRAAGRRLRARRRCAVVGGLQNNPLDLIERDLVVAAVIEFRRAGTFVRRHLLGIFEQPAVEQIDGDPGRPKRVAPEPRDDAGLQARRTIIRRASWRVMRSPSRFRPRPPSVRKRGDALSAPIPAAFTYSSR